MGRSAFDVRRDRHFSPRLQPRSQRLDLLFEEGDRVLAERESQRRVGKGTLGRVARTIAILRRDFARPLRVDALAREVGMSPSGLHRRFKEVTAMSPLQFQKRLRLREARRLMLGESLDAAGAAFRVGYESPSQFSREYRREFGAPPAEDVSRLRREAPEG